MDFRAETAQRRVAPTLATECLAAEANLGSRLVASEVRPAIHQLALQRPEGPLLRSILGPTPRAIDTDLETVVL